MTFQFYFDKINRLSPPRAKKRGKRAAKEHLENCIVQAKKRRKDKRSVRADGNRLVHEVMTGGEPFHGLAQRIECRAGS